MPTFTRSASSVTHGIDGLDRDRAEEFGESWRVCIEGPTSAQRWAGSAGPLLGFLALIGALLLTRRAVRGARRDGLFTSTAAHRVRVLGWFMLATASAVPLVSSAATTWVMSGVVRDWDWSAWGPGMLFSAPVSALTRSYERRMSTGDR